MMKLFCEFTEIASNNAYSKFSFLLHFRAKLNETKLTQKLRVKPKGVNAVALAIGKKVTTEDLVLKVIKLFKRIYL